MLDEEYMRKSIKLAKMCEKFKDIPVGAVIVKDNKIISRGYNQKEKYKNAIKHAEIVAIEKASKKLKNFRLDGCTIYVTKEPCLMCLGAIMSARIDKLVYGAFDPKYSNIDKLNELKFNHKLEVVGGVLENECASLLTNFFKKLRGEKL